MHCHSCGEFIEDTGVQLSEPYDHQPDGSYRVTILNTDAVCPGCGGLLFEQA